MSTRHPCCRRSKTNVCYEVKHTLFQGSKGPIHSNYVSIHTSEDRHARFKLYSPLLSCQASGTLPWKETTRGNCTADAKEYFSTRVNPSFGGIVACSIDEYQL